MEKKEQIKVSLSIFFLIIAIIVIAVMGYFMHKIYNEKISIEEVKSSNSQVATLQDKINKVSDITNNDNTNTTVNKSLVENEKSIVQTLDANVYKIDLYSNNEVEIIPNEEEINTIFGSTSIKTNSQKKYKIIGFNEKINKMFQTNNGTGVDPITFFIMDNGTVSYIQPLEQIMQNNYTIPEKFEITGKIKDLNNVVDLKISDKNDLLVIAITKDGKEIKCWNQWTEDM